MSRTTKPLLAALLATTLAACGGADSAAPRSPSGAAAPESEPEPTTIEEAQAQIERARAALEGSRDDAKTAEPEAAPAPADAAAERPPKASRREAEGAASGSGADKDACSAPCRALASMRRAATALCRMTGDADKRCVAARQTVADSESRLPSCRCS